MNTPAENTQAFGELLVVFDQAHKSYSFGIPGPVGWRTATARPDDDQYWDLEAVFERRRQPGNRLPCGASVEFSPGVGGVSARSRQRM